MTDTRRPRGDPRPYRRASDGRWVAAIELPPRTGRRRRYVYATTQKEALRKRNAVQAELERRGDLHADTTTVEQWVRYWADDITGPTNKPSTARTYRSYIDNWIAPHLGKHRLDRLRPDHIRGMLRAMADAGRPESTRGHALAILKAALEVAVVEQRIVANPVRHLRDQPRRHTGVKSPKAVLSVPQARTVLDHIGGTRDEARWWFAICYGLRQGEALGLTWDRVDFDKATVTVDRSLTTVPYRHGCRVACGRKRAASCPDRRLAVGADVECRQLHGTLCLVQPKSAESRRILPLLPEAFGQLRRRQVAYLAERQADGYTDHGLVWGRADGRPVHPHRDYDAWRAMLRGLGLPAMGVHGARNAALSAALDGGAPLSYAAHVAGHANMEVTQGYARKDPDQLRKALAAGVAQLTG